MKTTLTILFLASSVTIFAQGLISENAPYLGVWYFDGNFENAPEMLQDLPQYRLEFNAGNKPSCISFEAHDEIGYPRPNYFIAKIEGDKITGDVSHSPAAGYLTGEKVEFDLEHDPVTDRLILRWNGKAYQYVRE